MKNDFSRYIDSDSDRVAWKVLARADSLVEAIKDFRSRYGSGLKEAKDVVEDYINQYKTKHLTEKRVRLADGSEVIVKDLINGDVHLTLFKSEDLGVHTRDALLQAIATLAAQSVPGPRA